VLIIICFAPGEFNGYSAKNHGYAQWKRLALDDHIYFIGTVIALAVLTVSFFDNSNFFKVN
jgi:hypothetical protein